MSPVETLLLEPTGQTRLSTVIDRTWFSTLYRQFFNATVRRSASDLCIEDSRDHQIYISCPPLTIHAKRYSRRQHRNVICIHIHRVVHSRSFFCKGYISTPYLPSGSPTGTSFDGRNVEPWITPSYFPSLATRILVSHPSCREQNMAQVHMQAAVHTTSHFTCWFGIGCEMRCDHGDALRRRRFQSARAVSPCSM